jgi:hypothetical protein
MAFSHLYKLLLNSLYINYKEAVNPFRNTIRNFALAGPGRRFARSGRGRRAAVEASRRGV